MKNVKIIFRFVIITIFIIIALWIYLDESRITQRTYYFNKYDLNYIYLNKENNYVYIVFNNKKIYIPYDLYAISLKNPGDIFIVTANSVYDGKFKHKKYELQFNHCFENSHQALKSYRITFDTKEERDKYVNIAERIIFKNNEEIPFN